MVLVKETLTLKSVFEQKEQQSYESFWVRFHTLVMVWSSVFIKPTALETCYSNKMLFPFLNRILVELNYWNPNKIRLSFRVDFPLLQSAF